MRFAFRKLDATLVYYILTGVQTLAGAIMFTALGVYYINQIGMSPLQLVLVGTVLETTILIFEIPTGVVADTYSRRMSVTIGMFVLAAAWLVEGSFPIFFMVLVAEFIRGVGETFLSGALDAWLADEVGEQNVGRIYLRSGQVNRVVWIVGVLASMGIASIQLNWAVLTGGILFLGLGLFLVVAMPENGFRPAQNGERTTWRTAVGTFKDGARVVRRSSLLLLLLLVSTVGGAASEGYDRLWEAHYLKDLVFPLAGRFSPVVWFGIMNIAFSLVGLGVTEALRKRLEKATTQPGKIARFLVGLNLFTVSTTIVFALAGNFGLAFAAQLAGSVSQGLYYPLYGSWLVQQIEPRVRATVLSMIGQSNALGQAVFGPAVGAIGSAFSIRAALVAAALLLTPISVLFAGVARRGSQPALPVESEPIAPEV